MQHCRGSWSTIQGLPPKPALYRPIAQKTGVSSNPLAPGWFQGPNSNQQRGLQWCGGDHRCFRSDVRAQRGDSAGSGTGGGLSLPGERVHSNGGVDGRELLRRGHGAHTFGRAAHGRGNAQAEWFAGSSPQNLATSIGSGACPPSITLANSINPVPVLRIECCPVRDGADRRGAVHVFRQVRLRPTQPRRTPSMASQCARNGTTRAAHAVGATVVPLNPFQPSYPWPVTPTINTNDTTPSATAGYFPGWNVGNAAFAFPVATGINQGSGARFVECQRQDREPFVL